MWKARKTESFECPSGEIVQVRRPGPEFMVRAGRVARTFTRTVAKEKPETQSMEEYGLDVIASMPDDELATVMVFAREMVCAMCVSPRLVKNPNPNLDEIGPDDIPIADFWALFNYGMSGFFNLKVPVVNGEVEVSDLQTFRGDGGVSGDSVDSTHVLSTTEQCVGNQGLVDSARA